MSEPNYSLGEIAELGISVCTSCGGANINLNKLPSDYHADKENNYCFDCGFSEGITTCMPDDETFYPLAQETIDKNDTLQKF